MASLQRHVVIAFLRSLQGVLSRFFGFFLWRFSALSIRFHGSYNKCTALSWRSHCAEGVLKTRRHIKERRAISVQTPCKPHGRPRGSHNDPCAHPLSSYCVVGNLTARLWRHYGDPTALFKSALVTPSHGVCFEHAQSARRRLAF